MNGFTRYNKCSLVIVSIPFDDLPIKYDNAFDFLVRPSGVSIVTPTELDCRGMMNLTLSPGTLQKNHPRFGMVLGRCNPHHPAILFATIGVDV